MKKQKLKPIPRFKSEREERKFWETKALDSTAYVDWSGAQEVVLPNLKPSTRAISLRLPETLISELKVQANKMDVPYQSLMKLWLVEKLEEKQQRQNWQTV